VAVITCGAVMNLCIWVHLVEKLSEILESLELLWVTCVETYTLFISPANDPDSD
jgi:hypothetical protein